MSARECPKCDHAMEEGFVLDRSHSIMTQSSWVEGKPDKSFWLGLKLAGHEKYEVTTFRCTKCGYLESYALPGERP